MPTITFTLFGNPAIASDGEPITGLPSAKVAALAYYLAATHRTHSRDSLAGLLWPDYGNAQAKKNLRGALYHLRNKLGDALTASRQQIGLNPDQHFAIDCIAFDEAVQIAQQLPEGSRERTEHLRRAANLYQGEFLEGFYLADSDLFDEWAFGERERYNQVVMQALNYLTAANANQGNLLEGIDYASRLLALDPWREEAHRQLMLMLAMDGQQSAALAQYKNCRQLLDEELGVEPSAETKELHERIRAGEFTLPTTPVAIPSSRPRHNLTADRTGFYGRETELQMGLNHLSDPACRLLTITGVGGIGKTRLARQIAHKLADSLDKAKSDESTNEPFLDGVFLVPLAGLEPNEQNDNLLAVTIADNLRLPLSGSEAPSTELLTSLYGQHLLLVLDNFEQLVDATPYIVTLLEQAPNLKLVVTSRTRLNIRGERVMPLNGLDVPDLTEIDQIDRFAATGLFLNTARSVSHDFAPTGEDQAAIVHTCRLVNGMPLGIELAASWTRLLSCREIFDEIKQNLDFLTSTMPDLPDRHRSMRAVFDQSWGLLSAEERVAMQRLSIFRGGFTRRAAEAVTDIRLDALSALIDKSLIKRCRDSGAEGVANPQTRFELLEILRQYAWEHLIASGDMEATAQRHAHYYANFMQANEQDLRVGNQQETLDAIAMEIENLRAASSWAAANIATDPQFTLELAGKVTESLFHFYDMRSWCQEGDTFFGSGVDLLSAQEALTPNPALAVQRARFQAYQGWFKYHMAQYDESETLLRTGLKTLRKHDMVAASVFPLNYLAAVLNHTGRPDEAKPYLQQALDLAQEQGDQFSASITYNIMAQVARWQGDLDAARHFSHQALQIKRAIGDRRGMFYSLAYLGTTAQTAGNYGESTALLEEALAVAQEIGDRRAIATALMNLADTAQARGDVIGARRLYQESLESFRNIGDQRQASLVLTRLGEQAAAHSDFQVAAISLREALYIARSIRSRPALVTALIGALDWFARLGDAGQAFRLIAALQGEPSVAEEQLARLADIQSQIDREIHTSKRQTIETPSDDLKASVASAADQALPLLSPTTS